MSHESGDVLRPRDCVLLKSGTRKGDLPYVAKIAALWENPDDGRYPSITRNAEPTPLQI